MWKGWNRVQIFYMPGTAQQPDVPVDEEMDVTPTDAPVLTETPSEAITPTPQPSVKPTHIPSATPMPTEVPEPTQIPEPSVTPEPTETPWIEIEDENTPLSGGMDGFLSEVLEGAGHIGDLYNESLYVDVRPLADFYVEKDALGKGMAMTLVGGTFLLAATIALIGSDLTRRARKREEERWK